MAKSLIDKLRNVRNSVLLGGALAVASMGFVSCQLQPNPIPNPTPPTASLSITPMSGTAPLNSSINLTGSGTDGDITQYKLEIDKNEDGTIDETINQSSPISVPSYTFDTNSYVYGQVMDSSGMTSNKVKRVINVSPSQPGYVNVSGTLEDNETHTGRSGEVRVYINNVEDTVHRDLDGRAFSFNVPSGSNIKLEGAIEDSTGQISYVRTQNIGVVNSNQTGVLVRAVPYDSTVGPSGATYTPKQFIDFVKDLEGSNYFPQGPILRKSNIPNAEIVQKGPDQMGSNIFLSSDRINQKTQEWSDIIKNNFSNRIGLHIEVNPTMQHGHYDSSKGKVFSDNGWEVIVPVNANDSNLMILPGKYALGATEVYNRGTSGADVGNAVTYIVYNLGSTGLDGISSHEIGLAESYPLESHTLSDTQTISNSLVSLSSPSNVDKKFNHVIYEETYNAGENLDNILGTSF